MQKELDRFSLSSAANLDRFPTAWGDVLDPTESHKDLSVYRHEQEENGLVLVPGREILEQCGFESLPQDFSRLWSNLPVDPYFTGPVPTRFRRHAQLRLDADRNSLEWLPNDGYFQSKEYNPLFGGIVRRFASIERHSVTDQLLSSLIILAARDIFDMTGKWHVNVHLVRTVSDPTVPTPPAPEGPHRDGYECIALYLIGRNNDRGGETLILDQSDRELHRLTLNSPLDGLFIDDLRYRHDVTPIVADSKRCYRDMILTSYERPGTDWS